MKARFALLNQVVEEINLLNIKLCLLCKLFKNREHNNIITTYLSKITIIVNIVQSIAQLYIKYAKTLEIEISTINIATIKLETRSKKYVKRL